MNYAPGQNSADEDDVNAPSKKARKPYTLTKQRESWSNEEHDRFIKALQMYNRDWKKIEAFVGTKTVVQVWNSANSGQHFGVHSHHRVVSGVWQLSPDVNIFTRAQSLCSMCLQGQSELPASTILAVATPAYSSAEHT